MRLEFPIGTVLYEAAGWISAQRMSPDAPLVLLIQVSRDGRQYAYTTIQKLGTVFVIDQVNP